MTYPLAALGVMVEGSRLSRCSERIHNSDVPATDTLAPESGRTSVVAWEERFSEIMGADSKPACDTREALTLVTRGIHINSHGSIKGGGGGGL